jgi:hypothetical protein
MKYVNPKGIAVLIAALVVIQLVTGMLLSPLAGRILVKALNENTEARISVGRISVWPLTLGLSMKDLKIFDPDDESKRIIGVKKASMRLSPIGLLSKRFVVAGVDAHGVEIDLEGEPDGSFNVADIVKKEKPRPSDRLLDRLRKDRNLIDRILTFVRTKASAEAGDRMAGKKKIRTEVRSLPKGRKVSFVIERQDYLVDIRKIDVSSASIEVKDPQGHSIDIENARLILRGLKVDPEKGAFFNFLRVRGVLRKGGKDAGRVDLSYRLDYPRGSARMNADISARDVDLAATGFLFEGSLPIIVEKGDLTLSSRTSIVDGALDSRNDIKLRGHHFKPRGRGTVAGFIPAPVLCEALNETEPLELDISIGGTLGSPEFKGLDKSLKKIAEPYLEGKVKDTAKKVMEGFFEKDGSSGGTAETAGEKGSSAEETAEKAIRSIKSMFK